ncbi:RTA1 domain-containing protein [Candidatus Bathyarchaeota archaeon]|nr:RTA1 domain-containing protein [Candidatus Bathyarchaeota archaeon]
MHLDTPGDPRFKPAPRWPPANGIPASHDLYPPPPIPDRTVTMSDTDVTQLPPGVNPQDIDPPNYSNCNEVSLICPVSATVYGDYFTLGPCIFFLAAHSVLLLVQTYLGIRSRAWTYAGYLAVGSIFEIMGYAARAALSHNPWIYNAFVIQLVLLMLGPTLVAAAISVTFKHLVLWYGREWSFIRPVLYPWLFVGPDVFSIIIQAAGGVVSAIATGGEDPDQDLLDLGSGLLIGGVVFQMVNMIFCGGLMLYYLWNRKSGLKNRRQWLQKEEGENSSIIGKKPLGSSDRRTKIFLCAMAVAYVAIIIRCVYRYVLHPCRGDLSFWLTLCIVVSPSSRWAGGATSCRTRRSSSSSTAR